MRQTRERITLHTPELVVRDGSAPQVTFPQFAGAEAIVSHLSAVLLQAAALLPLRLGLLGRLVGGVRPELDLNLDLSGRTTAGAALVDLVGPRWTSRLSRCDST